MSTFRFSALLLVTVSPLLAAAEEKLIFNRDIRPILSDKCFACHGTDAKHRDSGRRLDTPEGAYAESDGIIAIKPGNLAASDAWVRITSDDKDEVMPPPKSHKSLSKSEKAIIGKWIEQGATYQKHWAFEPPVKTSIQYSVFSVQSGAAAGSSLNTEHRTLNTSPWAARNEVDGFVFERLKKEGLAPMPEAEKTKLIRRVSFALTGLPPSLAELNAFLNDPSANAYEKVVDRLLASPRYGEQMARYWLDAARYGDTHGLHLDNERSMWPYRDWVIGAFNRNLPFDQFTIEQLAGDLLPNPTQDQLIATGFNRCNVTTSEGGAIDAEFYFRYAVDRTSTTAQIWMGLTAGCAVCHDHKFDPLTQKEFYQLYSFFNSTADPAMDGNQLLTAPTVKVSSPEQTSRITQFDEKRAALEKQLQAEVAKTVYQEPASTVPPPPAREQTTLLVGDDFPAGAKVVSQPGGIAPKWVTKDQAPVASGNRALSVSGDAMAQFYYSEGAAPIVVPNDARFTFSVFIDPVSPPKAVMLQWNTGAWNHRVMWGDDKAIPGFGAPGTTERVVAGPLPQTGKWIELSVDAAQVGLASGDKVIGLAFTVDGGTALFDALSVVARIDEANDPAKSLLAWLKPREGKDTQGLPGEINKLLKTVPAAQRTAAQQQQLRDYYLLNVCDATKPAFAPLQAEIASVKKERDELDKSIPSTFVMKNRDKPRDSFVMKRGAYDQPGEKVVSDTPAMFPPLANKQNPTRLDLAKWLVSDKHPLTARVTVNRFWQQFFGVGLVKTSGDFGSQGQPPSHPELLDTLAVGFRESGWDIKKLVRLLVTSATFRQSSAAPAALWERDPQNRLLARGPRFRLDAEEIRDTTLAVSGLLDLTMGGRGVRTYQPPNIWEPVGYIRSNTRNYTQDHGGALYRRSIYTFLKRTAPPPFMVNFDAPSREQACTLRERSNTPLQALQLMNDVQCIEGARALAERMMTEGGASADQRITFAYRSVLARAPSPEEVAIVREAYDQHLAAYQQNVAAAGKFIRQGESKPKAGLPEPELAAWTLVANLVLNLDENLNRN